MLRLFAEVTFGWPGTPAPLPLLCRSSSQRRGKGLLGRCAIAGPICGPLTPQENKALATLTSMWNHQPAILPVKRAASRRAEVQLTSGPNVGPATLSSLFSGMMIIAGPASLCGLGVMDGPCNGCVCCSCPCPALPHEDVLPLPLDDGLFLLLKAGQGQQVWPGPMASAPGSPFGCLQENAGPWAPCVWGTGKGC